MTHRHSLFVALVALAMLGATCKGSEKRADPPAGPSTPEAGEPKDDPAAVRPQNKPQITDLEGIDISTIEPARRADFFRVLNDTYCYCGCPRTIAACLAVRAECSCTRCSDRMAKFITGAFHEGATAEEVETQLLEGFSEGYNGRPHEFDLSQQAINGPPDAKFTIVEFADFRCPHCAAAFEPLEEVVHKRRDVRLAYFYFPLSGGGDDSVRAAEAAEEARLQGKFWEYARVLFTNQHAVQEDDLLKYGKQVGLDTDRLKVALKNRTHRAKVLANKQLGESNRVLSTPTIFINGRPFGLARTVENLEMRLEMEAERGRCD